MSERASVDTPVASVQPNGTGAGTFYSRIADLLDDVTIGAQPVAPAEDTLEDLFAGIAPALVVPPAAAEATLAVPPYAEPVQPPARPAGVALAAEAAAHESEAARRPEVLPSALPAAAHIGVEVQPVAPVAPDEPPVPHDLSPAALAAATLAAGAVANANEADRRPEALPGALPAAAQYAAEVQPVAPVAPDEPPAPHAQLPAAPDNLPPPAETAAFVAGVSFPAWVPPWDESQRPATAPPVTREVPVVAPAPERSIFAPLALAAGLATDLPSAEQPVAAPPADLPPFLAAIPAASAAASTPAGVPAPAEISLVVPVLAVAGDETIHATVAAETAPVDVGASEAEGEAKTASASLVSIRGRMDGLSIEVGSGPWPEVIAALTARLGQASSFFREAKVALDVGGRAVAEDELSTVATVLSKHGMTLALVRTGAERTFQSALALGLTVTLEAADGAAMAEAAAATSNANIAGYFVYRGYLRSGNRLRRKEHILVIGDVNPGAEVISEGDVLVWGRLRGIVHAGAGGNSRAIVAALDMEPTQLRIADIMTASPDPQPGQPGKWFWQRSANKRPEVARIAHKAIVFEEWDTGRPGGLVSLRRGG